MNGIKTRFETPHYQESIAFYSTHLGLKIIQSWDNGLDKGTILGLHDSENGEAFLEIANRITPISYEGLSIQLRVPKLVDIINKIDGVLDFRGPVLRPWGSTYLYLRDPSGIQVILYEGRL